MQTGVFRTQNDVVTYLLARMIGKSESPVGAWTLKEELEQSGINYGTATVGRYLKELDSRGMTEQRSNQGRILTEDGKNGWQRCPAMWPEPKCTMNLQKRSG